MPDIDADEEQKFESACRFIIRLGTLAHGYGPHARRLESYLSRVTTALGYRGIFSSTPTSLSFTFMKKDDELWQKQHLVPLPGTGFDLAKLAKVGDLVNDVEEGLVSIDRATEILDEISAMPPPYRNWMVAVAYAMCGAGFAGFLQGSWWDILLATVFSLVTFFMVTYAGQFTGRFADWTPFLCALIAGILSAVAGFFLPGINIYLVTLSAIIYLIPGFSISVGVIELTTKHYISGIANLINGLICLALLFAGSWLGVTMAGVLLPAHAAAAVTISPVWVWPFAMLLAAGLIIAFQTPIRDLFWALACCAIACAGLVLGIHIQGADLGNFLGTALAMIFANVWSDRTNRPTSIVILPAFVFMVSGSIGFRGLVAISAGSTALGFSEFTHMFVVAITLAVGLVVGNLVYKPRVLL
ncbi:threonine/serine exporter family protein [uncultured Methanoregula sp.]|uniref:threonine/serine ThrE exporter family protein n=1 Tax=uncultured Methanoregula sp. TaxID=1005933 RepID=UPI002AABEA03|nr:threonine/serine exporter family protein [uncultured Methanoregula sp.]